MTSYYVYNICIYPEQRPLVFISLVPNSDKNYLYLTGCWRVIGFRGRRALLDLSLGAWDNSEIFTWNKRPEMQTNVFWLLRKRRTTNCLFLLCFYFLHSRSASYFLSFLELWLHWDPGPHWWRGIILWITLTYKGSVCIWKAWIFLHNLSIATNGILHEFINWKPYTFLIFFSLTFVNILVTFSFFF